MREGYLWENNGRDDASPYAAFIFAPREFSSPIELMDSSYYITIG